MSYTILTDDNWSAEVIKSDIPVLVDFWADWCGPCKAFAPTIEALAVEYAGKVKIGKLNVDENPATAQKYRVMTIPTLILFKDGEVTSQQAGSSSRDEVINNFALDKL